MKAPTSLQHRFERRMRTFLLAFACLASLASAQKSRQRHPSLVVELATEKVELPFDHWDGHTNLPVMLGNEGPFEFQYDTYASFCATIDQDLAERLDLPRIGKLPNSDGTRIVMRDVVMIDEIRMGGVTLRNVQALVDDYSFVPTKQGSLQGLIGFPALRSKLVTFDYPESRLLIQEGQLDASAKGTLPFSLSTGCPDLQLDIGGESTVIGIDTGSSSGFLLDTRIADRLQLTEHLVPKGQARTVYSTHDLLRGVLPAPIHLAGFDIQPPSALFFPFPEERGLVGYRVLRSFAVTFDGPNKLVRFVRPPQPKAVALSEPELQAWVGTYVDEDRTYRIERQNDSLILREDELPGVSTIPLGPKELLLGSAPIRLRLGTDPGGKPSLEIQSHPGQPTRTALRRSPPNE